MRGLYTSRGNLSLNKDRFPRSLALPRNDVMGSSAATAYVPLCLWVYKNIPARVWYNVKLLSFPFVFVGVFDGDMVKNGNLLVEHVKYSLYFEDIFSDILYFCISINPE